MKRDHCRRQDWSFHWPTPPLGIALVEPEIPPNTGTIARLCAGTGSPLHLVGRLGFRLTDAQVRRAGLDYWDAVTLARHADFAAFAAATAPARRICFSTRAPRLYTAIAYQPGDLLVFGRESQGLPDAILDAHPGTVAGIPMRSDRVRSLNLATAVAIVLYEALRQLNAQGAPTHA